MSRHRTGDWWQLSGPSVSIGASGGANARAFGESADYADAVGQRRVDMPSAAADPDGDPGAGPPPMPERSDGSANKSAEVRGFLRRTFDAGRGTLREWLDTVRVWFTKRLKYWRVCLSSGGAAVVVAAFPFLILRYSTRETGGWFGHVLHGGWFWWAFAVWLVIVLVFSYLGVDLGLRSTSDDIHAVRDTVESTANKLASSQGELNVAVGQLRDRYQEGIHVVGELETRVQKGREALEKSLSEYRVEVDNLLGNIEAKDRALDSRVDRAMSTMTQSAQDVADATHTVGVIVKLNAQLETTQRIIEEMLGGRFDCGPRWATLADSRTLVYIVKNDAARTIVPFYLPQHVWWAVTGTGRPPEAVVLNSLKVERARSGEGTVWSISPEEAKELPVILQNVDRRGVTLPCPVDGPVTGVIVFTRPARDGVLFNPTNGERSDCFGTATDVIANASDAIAPYLAEIRDQLEPRSATRPWT